MWVFAVIEDIKDTNDQFKAFLEKTWPGSKVFQYFSYEAAAVGLADHDFDLVVSDIDLGEGTDRFGGFKIARAFDLQKTPFLIVSGTHQADVQRDIFKALDAWDYMQKPVTEADFVMQARRAVAFREAQKGKQGPLKLEKAAGDLVIDIEAKDQVKWNGRRVNLSMTQIRLLKLLVSRVGEAIHFDSFYEQIDSGKNKENLRVHIREIRDAFQQIDTTFDRLKTKYMIGYFWSVDEN